MWTTVVSEKGQVVIPAELRAETDLRRGDRLTVELRDGALVLRQLPRNPFAALYGAFAGGDSLTAALLREHVAEQSMEAREDAAHYHAGADGPAIVGAPPLPPGARQRRSGHGRLGALPAFDRSILDAPVSTSSKIRRLAAAGLTKSQIAQELTGAYADAGSDRRVRYQFVYDVLARAARQPRRREPD